MGLDVELSHTSVNDFSVLRSGVQDGHEVAAATLLAASVVGGCAGVGGVGWWGGRAHLVVDRLT